MTVLSEQEIEDLKKTHPLKRILRIIFLITGFILIALGIVLLLLNIDYGVTIGDINISFVIDLILIVFGMIIASKYWIAPYYLRENSLTLKRLRDLREPVKKYVKFNSFALTRLLAAIFLITIGMWTYTVFGSGIGHGETRYGNAIVLGGPSYFYVTGLPALIIGGSLLLYVLLSVFRGTFSKSENFYFFYELRPLCPWLTEIPKKDIEAIRYQNNHLGPKLVWILLLMPFIVLQLMTGVPLYFNNERQAPEYVFSNTLTFISILEIIALIILVFVHQQYFEIATDEMLYEMWFSPLRLRNQPELTEKIADFFNCGIDKDIISERERELEMIHSDSQGSANNLFSNVSNTHFQLFNTLFGLFLMVSAIIMATNMILFGPLFWWITLMYGFMLLVKAFNEDFSRKGATLFEYNPEKKIFKFQKRFAYKFQYITAYKVESVKVKKWFRRLDFFDIFGICGMLIMLTLQQTEGWAIIDPEIVQSNVIYDNIISTIYMAVCFFLIFLYLCVPIDVIEFKTPTIVYRIPITIKTENQNFFKKCLFNLKNFMKDIKENNAMKTFKIRLGAFLTLIIGTLIFTTILLISYFM
ncbi:MAG: hypothetical protein ACP6IY_12915 [Promethearchaeia archaeon]